MRVLVLVHDLKEHSKVITRLYDSCMCRCHSAQVPMNVLCAQVSKEYRQVTRRLEDEVTTTRQLRKEMDHKDRDLLGTRKELAMVEKRLVVFPSFRFDSYLF